VTATVKEIKIMKDLKSPFTLKYYGCYNKDDAIWIIMEYCDGGSLQDIIDARENEEVCLTEQQIAQIVAQVLQALEYLHSMKKIHRDIKAGNILLNSQGMAKLADFGISAQQVGDEKRTTTIGSSYWMAPETLMGGGYDSKADIWSLGITIMEMAEGIPPLIEEQPHKAAFRIVNDPPPKLSAPQAWSKNFVDFVTHCLTKNPEHRPTSAELRKHPFIAEVTDQKDAVIELINWSTKDKKKRIKKKKSKTADVEDEFNLTIWFEEQNLQKTFLLPGHATAEDVCRQCAESTKTAKDPKTYGIFVVIDDSGKPKEKKMGTYDLPGKILATLQKRFKGKKPKAGGPEPYKFVYKSGWRTCFIILSLEQTCFIILSLEQTLFTLRVHTHNIKTSKKKYLTNTSSTMNTGKLSPSFHFSLSTVSTRLAQDSLGDQKKRKKKTSNKPAPFECVHRSHVP